MMIDGLSNRQVKEEEGEYENASYHNDDGAEHAEEAQLVQPLSTEEGEDNSVIVGSLQLCKVGVEGPCTRNVCFADRGRMGYGGKCRVASRGAHAVRGRGEIRYEHDMEGCVVGAVGGAVFAAFSSAGLATTAGAYAGCAIGAGFVELF